MNINIDYYDDKLTADRDAISQAVQRAHAALTHKDKARLARRLNNPTVSLYPLDTLNSSYAQFKYAFTPPADEPDPSLAQAKPSAAAPDPFVFKSGGGAAPPKRSPHVCGKKKYRQRGRREYASRRFASKQRYLFEDRYVQIQQQQTREPQPDQTSAASSTDQPAGSGTAAAGAEEGRTLLCRTIEVGRCALPLDDQLDAQCVASVWPCDDIA